MTPRLTHAARRPAIVFLLLCLTWPSVALARKDYADEDFGNRFASGFIRFTEVSAMGGTTAANRWSSAINPASADWTAAPTRLGLILAPYYSNIHFGEGTRLGVYGESVTWQSETFGTIQPTLSQIRSNTSTNRQGLVFDYTVDIVQVQWAKRLGTCAVGAALNYNQAELIHEMGALRVSESRADSYRLRVGGLVQPVEKLLAGLVCEYGFAPYRAWLTSLGPFGLVTTRKRGVQSQLVLRPGLSYEYDELSTVFMDYQYGRFWNRDGALHSHWVMPGVDHRVFDWLFARAAAPFDARKRRPLPRRRSAPRQTVFPRSRLPVRSPA